MLTLFISVARVKEHILPPRLIKNPITPDLDRLVVFFDVEIDLRAHDAFDQLLTLSCELP